MITLQKLPRVLTVVAVLIIFRRPIYMYFTLVRLRPHCILLLYTIVKQIGLHDDDDDDDDDDDEEDKWTISFISSQTDVPGTLNP